MIGAVIGISLGFCAAMSNTDGQYRDQPTIFLGYISEGQCIFREELTGTNMDSPITRREHSFTWQQLDGGGEVCVDERCFVINAFRGT